MSTSTLIAIYFLIWWVTLFAILPWGVRNQEESGEVIPGTDPGAPAMHRVWQKLGWTTAVATVKPDNTAASARPRSDIGATVAAVADAAGM